MRASWPAVAIATTVLALAAVGGQGATARAQARVPASPAVSMSYRVPGWLFGLAAASPDNIWAVGWAGSYFGTGQSPLALHWNGRTWSRVTIAGVPYGQLFAVTAASADDVWAVGYSVNSAGGDFRTLVVHWNGRRWSRVASLSDIGCLTGTVAATATDVWVACIGTAVKFLHLTGGRWYVVPAVQPVGAAVSSVAVVTPTMAWAGGSATPPGGGPVAAFVWRWNGSLWKPVQVPLHTPGSDVFDMASGPGDALWAVGSAVGANPVPVSMRWDGKVWQNVPVRVLGPEELLGVCFVPGGSGGAAWAVGGNWTLSHETISVGRALIVRWTGRAWTRVPAPGGFLQAVTATSATDAWAVGWSLPSGATQPETLILHWNGTTWS